LKGESERHESRIHFNEERILELEAQHGKRLRKLPKPTNASARRRNRLSRLRASLPTQRRHWSSTDKRLKSDGVRWKPLRDKCGTSRKGCERPQAEAFAAAQQLSRVRNEITALDLQRQGNLVRLEKLSAEKVQLEAERQRLEARLQEFAAAVEVERLNAQTSRGSLEQRQERLREIQQELDATTQELDKYLREQARNAFAAERTRAASGRTRRFWRGRSNRTQAKQSRAGFAGRPYPGASRICHSH